MEGVEGWSKVESLYLLRIQVWAIQLNFRIRPIMEGGGEWGGYQTEPIIPL